MRILFICAAGIVSGKERQTLSTMVELKRNGHEVSCITAAWGSGEFAKLLLDSGIPFTRERLGFISKTLSFSALMMTFHQLLYIPSLFWRYRAFLRKHDPEVVIHTNFHHIFLLWPMLRNPRQVFVVHDFFYPTSFYRRLFSFFDRRISHYIAVSNFIKDALLALGINDSKIDTVYNGVTPPDRIENMKADDTLWIGIVGQITPMKGHEILLEAITPVLKSNPRAQLHFVGNGTEAYLEKISLQVEALGLKQQVIFRGRVNSLHKIYEGMDIICVPSLEQESFGLTAAEPGFFRIPVICSDRGGLPEVIENKVTGIVVPAGNVSELQKALENLSSSRDERMRMGEAALKRVERLFSIKKNTEALVSVLEKSRR